MKYTDYDAINRLRQKPLLTVKDLQQILGIGRTSAYRFLHDNPPFRVMRINGSIRISSHSVFDWLDENNQ